MEKKTRPIFAGLSLGIVLIPLGYLVLLLSGGGSEGFGAWQDLAWLLGMMVASAVIGLILSASSAKREENTKLNVLAIIIHCLMLFVLLVAFSQI